MARISSDVILDQICTSGETYSEIVPLDNIYGYSVEADWTTDGCNAVIYLLGTNDLTKPDDKYLPIECSSETVKVTGGKLWNVMWPMYRFFRVKVIVYSGTVNVKINFFCKGG